MADDSTSTSSGSLPNKILRIKALKFKEPLSIQDVVRFIPGPNHEIVALLRSNGALDVLNLRRERTKSGQLLKGLPNVKGCHWSSQRQLHTLDQAGNLRELTVGDNGVSVSKCCSQAQLAAVFKQEKLDEPSQLELLGCVSGMDIVLVNSSQVVTVQLLSGSCRVAAIFSLPFALPPQSPLPLVQLAQHCLVLLSQENHQLYIFQAATGSLHHVFYLQQLGLDLDNLRFWQVSHDLERLVLVQGSGAVQLVAFRQCRQSSACRSLQQSQPEDQAVFVPDVHTCDFGEESWREKLALLHQPDLSRPVVPWFEETRGQSGKAEVATVTRFRSQQPAGPMARDKAPVTSLGFLPEEFHSFGIADMAVSPDMVAISLMSRQLHQNGICVVSLSSSHCTQHVFADDHYIVLSREASYPHLLLTAKCVAFLALPSHFQQEDFVNRLMQYGSARLVDTVSLVNHWGHSSLPVAMLEIGIKHRQLDTIALFLRTKTSLFTKPKAPSPTTPTTPSTPSSPGGLLSWKQPVSHKEQFGAMEPALHLLLNAVQESVGEQSSRQFGTQLLFSTINYLHNLLKDCLTAREQLIREEGRAKEIEDLLTLARTVVIYISHLRPSLALGVAGRGRGASAESTAPGDEQTPALTELHVQDAVKAVLQGNSVMLMQHQLLAAEHEKDATMSCISALGKQQILEYLQRGETSQAEQVLFSLGYDKAEKLWELGLYVSDQRLLQVITNLFCQSLCLSPDKVAIVSFLQQLYQHYPCRVFSQAILDKSREAESSKGPWSESDALFPCLHPTTVMQNSPCGDIGGRGRRGRGRPAPMPLSC